jgi:hypothetical protein
MSELEYIRLKAREDRRGVIVDENRTLHILASNGYAHCMQPHPKRKQMHAGDGRCEVLNAVPNGAKVCGGCAMLGAAREKRDLIAVACKRREDESAMVRYVAGARSGSRAGPVLRELRKA